MWYRLRLQLFPTHSCLIAPNQLTTAQTPRCLAFLLFCKSPLKASLDLGIPQTRPKSCMLDTDRQEFEDLISAEDRHPKGDADLQHRLGFGIGPKFRQKEAKFLRFSRKNVICTTTVLISSAVVWKYPPFVFFLQILVKTLSKEKNANWPKNPVKLAR